MLTTQQRKNGDQEDILAEFRGLELNVVAFCHEIIEFVKKKKHFSFSLLKQILRHRKVAFQPI